ncbi:hypothetical protein BGX26_002538 [Mortierella sp. AD094]|nr:hypothetical protein BGX26_002538 [Mortierella sp. AD094]
MRFFLGIVTVALSAVSVMAANSCNVGGLAGSCISTTSCASSGGTSTAGHCPNDPNNILCCTYGGCKTKDGLSGNCVSTSACSGTSIAGLCPGPSNIECCVANAPAPTPCKVSDGRTGTCISTSSCSGTSVPGFCAGPSNIQCCVPEATNPSCKVSDGRTGTCLPTSSCSGTSVPGFCSGPSNIQCCVPKATGPSCKVGDGRTGTCLPTSSCSGTPVPGYCSGPSNIQCCVSGSPPSTGGNLPGLNARQSGYARTIANVAHSYGVGARGCAVAIATALVESNISVLCSYKVPGSCNLPHDGVGSDHLSVGIFQQQSPMWGTAQQCMDPASSAGLFYQALNRYSGWASLPIGTAAQKVQHSQYPDRYAARVNQAVSICSQAY